MHAGKPANTSERLTRRRHCGAVIDENKTTMAGGSFCEQLRSCWVIVLSCVGCRVRDAGSDGV